MQQNRNGTVKIIWCGGDRFDIQIGRHTVRVDQPTDFGGGDTGPAPVELFVGSLAACVAHRAERYLHRCQLPAGVTVTAHYDLGLQPARVGRIELVVDAPGLPAGLRESFVTVIEHSAVHNSLRLPPEITVQIRTAEGDATLRGMGRASRTSRRGGVRRRFTWRSPVPEGRQAGSLIRGQGQPPARQRGR